MKPLLVKKAHEEAVIPCYAKQGDAGFDLYTCDDIVLAPQQTKVVPTGIALEIPRFHEVQIRPRSGISLNGLAVDILSINDDLSVSVSQGKEYVRVQLGTVDEGYKAPIGIITYNQSDKYIRIRKHTKLAQAVLNRIAIGSLAETDTLSSSERGQAGFGSTGV